MRDASVLLRPTLVVIGILIIRSDKQLASCLQNESLTYFIAANQTAGFARNPNNKATDNLGAEFVVEAEVDALQECVGNRFEAAEQGRLCSKKCKKEVPCENSRKQCLCDGLCGMSCVRPDLSCPELVAPKNGFLKTLSDGGASVFGTKVMYSCDENFYLFGSKTRTCLGDEEWSGVAAECLPEPSCKNPPKITHAKNPSQNQVYRLADRVAYSCYLGYDAVGSSGAECKFVEGGNETAWAWDGAKFRCLPKSCQEPPPVDNARKIGDSYVVSSSVSYVCNEGYEMIGQSKRYCQSDGQWSGKPPQCEPVTCNPSDHLENGRIDYVYPLVYNSSVEYSCDHGFKLVGLQTRKCGPLKALLGSIPKCEEIDCGPQSPLHNGYVKGYGSRMGDKKEYICLDGMKFVGSSRESMCQKDGYWSHPLPKCLAPCVIPQVEHALGVVVSDKDEVELDEKFAKKQCLPMITTGSTVMHDSVVDILCETGYELDDWHDETGMSQLPRCDDGQWTYEPRCRLASCIKIPKAPKNGRLTVFSDRHNTKALIRCLDGFMLQGDPESIECINSNWTVSAAKCVDAYCKNPGVLENGSIQIAGQFGMYDIKPYITRIGHNKQLAFECNAGFVLKDGTPNAATCLNGKWRPEGLPLCVLEVS